MPLERLVRGYYRAWLAGDRARELVCGGFRFASRAGCLNSEELVTVRGDPIAVTFSPSIE